MSTSLDEINSSNHFLLAQNAGFGWHKTVICNFAQAFSEGGMKDGALELELLLFFTFLLFFFYFVRKTLSYT